MKNYNSRKLSLLKVAVGVLNAYVITLFLLLALSAVFYFSSLAEDFMPKAVIAITALSIAFGSFKATKDLEHGGWLHGALIGLFYVALIIITRFFTNGMAYSSNMVLDLIIGILIGALAGAIGVNM